MNDPKLSAKTTEEKQSEEEKEGESSDPESDHEQQLENIRKKLKVDSIKKMPITKYYLDQDKKEERKKKQYVF